MTSYQIVYDAFLSKVTADDWVDEFADAQELLLNEEEIKQDLRSILENALPYFKYPRTSLARNDEGFRQLMDEVGIQINEAENFYVKLND
jgi:hypothetical protein